MRMVNKKECRKHADPGLRMNLRNGLLHAEQIRHIVRTALKNIGGQRLLVLYIYQREQAAAGIFKPAWTMFQSRTDYISLFRSEDGQTKWHTSAFTNLGRSYQFERSCAFYSPQDEARVARFCKSGIDEKPVDTLIRLQSRIQYRKELERRHRKERVILDRMQRLQALPRDLKGWIHRDIMPAYFFYNYRKGQHDVKGYCTACRHEVEISGVKHNHEGLCPRCKKKILFKSRGRRGFIRDRETVQVIQRLNSDELIIRILKAYYSYRGKDTPEISIYENARLFLGWEDKQKPKIDRYFYSYNSGDLTPWKNGDRPVFSRWQPNFEADCCGYLYHRNLDGVLKDTPWQYSQLRPYYLADPTPLYVLSYLQRYLQYPMVEYLVKLRLYRLATYLVFEYREGYYGEKCIDVKGKNIKEFLGVEKREIPVLQAINPGPGQLELMKALSCAGIPLDVELLRWCSEMEVKNPENILTPLRHTTPHKLMRYADEQFAKYRRRSYGVSGFYSMENLLSDYRDYLCMCEGLEYDLTNSFVLFPGNLPEAHDKVNDLSDEENAVIYDRQIAKAFAALQDRYHFEKGGLMMVPPHTAKEIMNEGHQLHHCVGSYVKQVVRRECVILFIRSQAEPEKPLCTVELRHNEIQQARAYRNQNPPRDIEKFINRWKKEILQLPTVAA